jgi:hypothetical protein
MLPNPDGPADWPTGWAWGEYFLVENRFQTGFDAALPGSGLAIWHIDEHREGNSSGGGERRLRTCGAMERAAHDDCPRVCSS